MLEDGFHKMRWGIIIIITLVLMCPPKGPTCVLNPRHKMWSRMVDINAVCRVTYGPGEHSGLFQGRSPVCCADGHRCSTLVYALFCPRWPSPVQAWVNAAAVVNLCITFPLSPRHCLPLFHSRTHTHTQANKLAVSWDVYLHLWVQRKTNCHQKATYGPFLMEHISWALSDTVTQRTHWLECFALLFELWA